ncbi:hypothetical protein IJU97_01500 [bacterium]|nr:hypothetical protein [bacterium]
MVSYTGSNTSCQNFVNKHNSFYNIYSSNWSQSDYCSDCGAYQLDNLYDSNAPFINLAYSRDIYSVSYDSSNNMV